MKAAVAMRVGGGSPRRGRIRGVRGPRCSSARAGRCRQALAQTPPAADASAPVVEEVVVTGSRIAAPNETSTSPIAVVTKEELQLEGKTDVIDLLNKLPQNFQNGVSDFSNTSSPCRDQAA